MRRIERVSVLLLLVVSLLFGSTSVMATDDRLGTVVGGTLLTNEIKTTGNTHALTRGTYLSYGFGALEKAGSGSVLVSGSTTCYRTSDKVRVTLYLERLVGSNWQNVEVIPTKTAYNTTYVSSSKTCSVSGGYYYRVKGTHVAIKGSTTETTASYTNGIWVD